MLLMLHNPETKTYQLKTLVVCQPQKIPHFLFLGKVLTLFCTTSSLHSIVLANFNGDSFSFFHFYNFKWQQFLRIAMLVLLALKKYTKCHHRSFCKIKSYSNLSNYSEQHMQGQHGNLRLKVHLCFKFNRGHIFLSNTASKCNCLNQ